MYPLNPEQQQVKIQIENMQPGDRLIISGRAGSGKSFAITVALEGKNVWFMAPTHPACEVLKQQVTSKNHKVSTVYSAIGWYQERDANLGQRDRYTRASTVKRREAKAKQLAHLCFSNIEYIVVDEFSMLNAFLFEAIEEYATAFNVKLIYSGDPCQLPSHDGKMVVLDQDYPMVMLEGSVRFSKHSAIYALAENLRYLIDHHPDAELPCIYADREIQVVTGHDFKNQLCQAYDRKDEFLAVTYCNKRLSKLRGAVRPAQSAELCPGDVVSSKRTDCLFKNGEQLVIHSVEKDRLEYTGLLSHGYPDGKISISGKRLRFESDERTAFIPDDPTKMKRHEARVKTLCDDGEITPDVAISIFAWLKIMNAFELSNLSTVHKSQGRTVDTVFIDTAFVLRRPDNMTPLEHKRLLYTAITRARKQVIFYEMQGLCERAQDEVVVPLHRPLEPLAA
ncbi:ATP-dependent DNA helicase [Tropicibacter sp. S64]|uniref:ATP-dependent DNA helicase n=1 Tax=Tropicibacter sp. S64 TaxID=3415122 RepID=UPI003C7E224D